MKEYKGATRNPEINGNIEMNFVGHKKEYVNHVVSVMGVNYTIEMVGNDHEEIDGHAGKCFLLDKSILINKDVDKRQMKVTLRHELIHAFMEESGFNSEVDNLTEEMWVDWFSMQFDKIKTAIESVKL